MDTDNWQRQLRNRWQTFLLLKYVPCSSGTNLFSIVCRVPDEIWRSLSVKGKKTSSQEGLAAWLPPAVTTVMCSYFTIISHKQQAPTVVEGRPSEGDGFVGPVTQGLGVPTEGLGHIWLTALAVLLWDSAGVDLNYLWQRSWGIQSEVSFFFFF